MNDKVEIVGSAGSVNFIDYNEFKELVKFESDQHKKFVEHLKKTRGLVFDMKLDFDFYKKGDVIMTHFMKSMIVLEEPRRKRTTLQSIIHYLTFKQCYKLTDTYKLKEIHREIE